MNVVLRFCLLAGVVAVAAMSQSVSCRADPAPATSTYLKTTTGGFVYEHDTRNWSIELDVKPLRRAPGGGPLYLRTSFENPNSSLPPLVVDDTSLDPALPKFGIQIKSSAVTGMRDRKGYRVIVNVYADKARTKLLGTHQQVLVYHNIGDPEAVLRRTSSRQR